MYIFLILSYCSLEKSWQFKISDHTIPSGDSNDFFYNIIWKIVLKNDLIIVNVSLVCNLLVSMQEKFDSRHCSPTHATPHARIFSKSCKKTCTT